MRDRTRETGQVNRHLLPLLVLAVAAVSGCSQGDDESASSTAVTLPAEMPVTAPERPEGLAIPFCSELPDPADSLDWSGIQQSLFPDPLRTGQALQLALSFPFVVDIWGGTGAREGWIVVAVSGGAVELQTMLDMQFPAARVLAMPIDWTFTELSGLAAQIVDATADLSPPATAAVSMSRGVVRIELGDLTDERMAALAAFADDPVCIADEL